jgi:histidinol dehydrogenase
MPVTLDATAPDFETAFVALLNAKREDSPDVDAVVADIITDVRTRGDAAVIDLTTKFDRLTLTPDTLRITPEEIAQAVDEVCAKDREALDLAASRIRAYHARQLPQNAEWTDEAGATLGWRWSPVSAAGLYVPGGLASYPSSVLMNAIPAKVAGVPRLAMVVPTPDGILNPLVLLAARKLWPLSPMAPKPSPPSTKSLAPATPLWPPPNAVSLAKSAST